MHDPFLKSVFADRRMAEILICGHVPEWADEIDFATLRKEPTQLVAKKTLQLRHPDLIWSADTVEGGPTATAPGTPPPARRISFGGRIRGGSAWSRGKRGRELVRRRTTSRLWYSGWRATSRRRTRC